MEGFLITLVHTEKCLTFEVIPKIHKSNRSGDNKQYSKEHNYVDKGQVTCDQVSVLKLVIHKCADVKGK